MWLNPHLSQRQLNALVRSVHVTGRAVASRLGLAWPPAKWIQRVHGDPLLMQCGSVRSQTGHEMCFLTVMTMICVFSTNVLVEQHVESLKQLNASEGSR